MQKRKKRNEKNVNTGIIILSFQKSLYSLPYTYYILYRMNYSLSNKLKKFNLEKLINMGIHVLCIMYSNNNF